MDFQMAKFTHYNISKYTTIYKHYHFSLFYLLASTVKLVTTKFKTITHNLSDRNVIVFSEARV